MSENQGCEWLRLYRRIKTALKPYGKSDYVTDDGLQVADYYFVQDNWGGLLHQIEVHSLHMLQPAVIKSLQNVLRDFPEWEIVVRVDVPGMETWPDMGLTVYADSICDALKREHFPAEYRNLAYEGVVSFAAEKRSPQRPLDED
jgi:hypothetical protein